MGITSTLLPAVSFARLFRIERRAKDKFLSRVFGIFCEDIVRAWAGSNHAPYKDLGRPTLKLPGEARGKTLDFTLESRRDGRTYVAEMKCELEFEGYKYLCLKDRLQLTHHTTDAFQRFPRVTREPDSYAVLVGRRAVRPAVGILVWGSVSPEGREDVKEATSVAEVLSLEDMIGDLLEWDEPAYHHLIEARAQWSAQLFGELLGKGSPLGANDP